MTTDRSVIYGLLRLFRNAETLEWPLEQVFNSGGLKNWFASAQPVSDKFRDTKSSHRSIGLGTSGSMEARHVCERATKYPSKRGKQGVEVSPRTVGVR